MNKCVKDVTIIIPSLNPDEKFIKTLDSILAKGFKDIVVVDDGSDGLHKIPFVYAEKKGCKVLIHTTNKGKGRALKTAFNYCSRHGKIGVVTVDGDGQHGADDIYACAEKMLETDKVVLGCRDFSEPQVPFKSKYGNNITKFAFRALCGIKISDTQTGLRAIPAKYLSDMLQISGERFEYETNMLLEMKKRGIPWVEQKIETIYLNDNESSHFNPIKDSIKIYNIILKYSFNKLFKYSASSLVCSMIDIIAFYAADNAMREFGFNAGREILVATVLARAISSFFNFMMNKTLVFKSGTENSVFKYYLLCCVQMFVSAGLVTVVNTIIPSETFGRTLIKLVVDTLLFLISYKIQKEWVFKNKSNGTEETFNIVGEVPSDEMVSTMIKMMCTQSVTVDKESLNRAMLRKETVASHIKGMHNDTQDSSRPSDEIIGDNHFALLSQYVREYCGYGKVPTGEQGEGMTTLLKASMIEGEVECVKEIK